MSFPDLFPHPRPLIGMVHLAALPGAPRFSGDLAEVERAALRDATILVEAGFEGLVVENYGDVPFRKDGVGPEPVAAMAVVARRVVAETGVPVGVNVLRNDARAALAIAAASGARFVRVNVHTGVTATDQGLIEGRAAETMRMRADLALDVAVLADVLVKHGAPLSPPDPARAARDAVHRGLADGLLVTGEATGTAADRARLDRVREAVPGTPVLVASGVTAKNAAELVPFSDGAIVGSAAKRGGRAEAPVDRKRARRLAEAIREARE